MEAKLSIVQYQLKQFGAPLDECLVRMPHLSGRQVLIEVAACGVCHTDLHVCSGHYDLGGGILLDASQRIALPATPGHEIAGTVAAIGPNCDPEILGKRVLVYPWMGCGTCEICASGDDPNCPNPSFLGIDAPGGYASHVLVRDQKYLLDIEETPFEDAASLACAGLTSWSALMKCPTFLPTDALVLIGAGGVGVATIKLARMMFPDLAILVCDLSEERRQLAVDSGATEFYSGPTAISGLAAASHWTIKAIIDCVGSGETVGHSVAVAAKGAHLIVVGLFGGAVDLSTLLLPTKNLTLRGSYVGTLDELKALFAFIKSHGGLEIPHVHYRLSEVGSAMADLEAGRVAGRAVLIPKS